MDAVPTMLHPRLILLEAIVPLTRHRLHNMECVLTTLHPRPILLEAIAHHRLHNMECVLTMLHPRPILLEAIVPLTRHNMECALIMLLPKQIKVEAIVLLTHLLFLLQYNLIQMLFLWQILNQRIHQHVQNQNLVLHVDDAQNHPLIVEKYPIMPVQIQNIYPFLF
jgi:hypothetical protein